MPEASTIEDRISVGYGNLSAKLRDAADFVVENPVDVATRSLRSISASSGLAPATFSRLARALGFESYEELRELSRSAVGRQFVSFSDKAQRLQDESDQAEEFWERHVNACVGNIQALGHLIKPERLQDAVDHLHLARNVMLIGSFGTTGIIEYMAYMGNYFASNWFIAGRMGASLSTSLTHMNERDVIVVLTTAPFAKRSILAAEIARERGAQVIVITDSYSCPALNYASVGLVHGTDSPLFFSSYAATVVIVETIIGMLVQRAGPSAKSRIEQVEDRNRRLGEFWSE